MASSTIMHALLNLRGAATHDMTRQVAAKSDSQTCPARLFDLSRFLRLIGLTVLAGFLIWEVGSRSVVAYLADSAPETAARLNPREPTALLNLAEQELNRPRASDVTGTKQAGRRGGAFPKEGNFNPRLPASKNDGSSSSNIDADLADERAAPEGGARSRQVGFGQRVRTWAESALLGAPISARGLRILGQLANEENNTQDALKFMRASARISIHESLAVYWAMQDSLEKHNYKTALFYCDALLRTRPSLMNYVAPALEKMAENKEANSAVKELLHDNPPWRLHFFTVLIDSISDARTPLDLLLSLRDSPNPPSLTELRPYLAFLIKHKFYDLAYYTWLQFLPPTQLTKVAFLFNGSFEFATSGLPFDWTIEYGSGVSIDVVPRNERRDDGGLFVEFGHGRVDYRGVTQMTMLTPGSYWFHGKYKGELVGPRGLKWRVSCAGADDRKIGESEMIIGAVPSWSNVGFQFTVPEADCRAQYVRLDLDARTASERLITGSVWFDELQIVRSDDVESR